MEYGKRSSSSSEGMRSPRMEKKTDSKSSILGKQKTKEEAVKCGLNEYPSKGKLLRQSMIPVVKCEKNVCELKNYLRNQKDVSSSSKCSSTSLITSQRNQDLDKKIKILEEKEKSIAEYYSRIENIVKNLLLQKENEKSPRRKTSQYSTTRKMTSDPSVFNNNKIRDSVLSDFESSIKQISDIWLKTSSDLSNILKSLKSHPSLDTKELEIENVRIQLAIKQAKSLTLVKTRDVIREAKKLFYSQEIIRRELENLLSHENVKCKSVEDIKKKQEEGSPIIVVKSIEKSKQGGRGDSFKETDVNNSENNRGGTHIRESEDEKETLKNHLTQQKSKDDFLELEKTYSDETLKEQSEFEETQNSPTKSTIGMEVWMKELAKKMKTITNLNNKIFELQKACQDHSLKYNQLQVKLAECEEKNQWNQVLWKQIRKLKEQIRSLQQNNKQLESQKKELENKITRLDQELDRQIKINHLLNQKKYLLKYHDLPEMECKKSDKECTRNKKEDEMTREKFYQTNEDEANSDERIFAEKQNAINQLKNILNTMIDQEKFAHKQISKFQSKIEELEKNSKA